MDALAAIAAAGAGADLTGQLVGRRLAPLAAAPLSRNRRGHGATATLADPPIPDHTGRPAEHLVEQIVSLVLAALQDYAV
ncbi:MAG TPA: hypothetical protein VH741_00285, partial [Candidatus Limnocylindrales bacterium]